ncbi:MAG: hypothetical protein ACTSQZ_00950 [Candidatus Thorarchaeota archaeon]
MERTVICTILSAELSKMGPKTYGYIGVETDEKENLTIKVSAFTIAETLDIGARVRIVGDSFSRDLWDAKTITRVTDN